MEPDVQTEPARGARQAAWASGVGLAAGLVGVVDGIYLVAQRHEAACPDGHYFPQGTTDFRCYVHPQAGLGVAVVALSVMLGVLIWLIAVEPNR